jgi:tetratricopeptide (TPR) repeat protein
MIAAVLFLGLTTGTWAGQDDALRDEVVKIGKVTGEDAFQGQLEELLENKEHAKKLIEVGVKMADAKDPGLTYFGALTLGQAAASFKDYKACESLYRVAMNQSVKLYSKTKILQSYGGLIDALYEGKKYADSVRICRELLEIKTGDGTPRKYYFLVEGRFGDFGFEEDPDFDLAKPLRSAVHQLMIQGLAKDGKFEQALKLTDNLVRASDHWKERQLRGWVLREAGRFAEAAKVYEDVLERIAKDKDLTQKGRDTYSDRYRHVLSIIYVESKQIDKAAEHLKALIERHPEDPGFYNDLGYIWADNDTNLKEAETMIRKALDLDREQRKKKEDFNPAKDRDKGAYLDSLGWVLFKQKRYEEAKKYLIEALKDKESQHIEIFDHLGETYLALGQRDQALDAWRRGLEVAGDDRREQQRKLEVEKKIQNNK